MSKERIALLLDRGKPNEPLSMTTNSKEKIQLELNYKCEYSKTRKPPPPTNSLTWKNTSKHMKAYRSTLLYSQCQRWKEQWQKIFNFGLFCCCFVAQPAFEQLSFFFHVHSALVLSCICVWFGVRFSVCWFGFFFLPRTYKSNLLNH